MIRSIDEFILRVKNLDNVSDAYDLFEYLCTDELRDIIYSIADPASAEPFRNAMHRLGFVNY